MRTQSFANYFYQPSGLIPGANLLDISKSCPHLKHAVFSLLKGRTLVVRGKNIEYLILLLYHIMFHREVKKTVNALSIFVPGGYNSEYGVIPLRTSCTLHPEKPVKCPIHIQELTHLRLVGVESSDPLVVGVQVNIYFWQTYTSKRNVSILSLDTQELIAPKYPRIADNRVQLIEELLGIRVDWPVCFVFVLFCFAFSYFLLTFKERERVSCPHTPDTIIYCYKGLFILPLVLRLSFTASTRAVGYLVSVKLNYSRSRSHSSSNPPIPDWRNSQESLHHSVPDYRSCVMSVVILLC